MMEEDVPRKKVIKACVEHEQNDAVRKALKKLFNKALDALIADGKVLQGDGDDKEINLTPKEKSELSESANKRSRAEKDSDSVEWTKRQRRNAADERESDENDTIAVATTCASSSSYPSPSVETDPTTILLFYAYCKPIMTSRQVDDAIAFCTGSLRTNGVTGRLRVAQEGYNATLTGPPDGIRAFTASLADLDWDTFGENRVDFKYVDGLPKNQRLKGIKCWAVSEIVTYGFDPQDAPMQMTGTHLKPREWHKALEDPNAVVIDVRNFNETLIGKFVPPGEEVKAVGTDDGSMKVLDPCMRRSTEFPQWVEDHKHMLQGKKVLMYCTGGVRCERASAFVKNKGIENVFQLDGGIHRYLEEYAKDGGYWKGKNYTFDRRFNHGAEEAQTISQCVACDEPWDRYQAKAKCSMRRCAMEILVCRACQRKDEGKFIKQNVHKWLCPLCKQK